MIADHQKYYSSLKNHLLEFFHNKDDIKIFIFGSSAKNKSFADIDIGIMGDVTTTEIRQLKEFFEESTFPFLVDVINFNNVDESFKNNVLDNKVIWIKP